MILTLDIGNTQIAGGLFVDGEIKLRFRKATSSSSSSDELGLFLKAILREHGFAPELVKKISLCTVVPEVLYTTVNACKKYFHCNPFVLQPGVKSSLKIGYKNPLEVGSDRIANAIAATNMFPQQNLVIIDFGTATTLCVVNKDKEYLGGVILAGLRISMEALEQRTAKLPTVEIIKPKQLVGRSTVESIQSGLFFSNLYAVKEMISQIQQNYFQNEKQLVIGTGGFSTLFRDEKIFDQHVPDLVLLGLYKALEINT